MQCPSGVLKTARASALTPASAPRHGGGGGGSSRYTEVTTTEVYSDNEDDSVPLAERTVIDIDAVSGLGESAPTSLVRERKLNSDKSGKGKQKAKKEDSEELVHKSAVSPPACLRSRLMQSSTRKTTTIPLHRQQKHGRRTYRRRC